ncbi:rhomboid family intramembrane serine protease [Sphaerisporangium corydalis]|uniref:Rhomboid family intramembrane serine protease n=1 Tax=Sphaerisporangium corydalis TaxID=1441875 RepID=A0ABV9EHB8_9ACTN|nr:rhomboid family intramembrane serine protease [Sphaerisporangium corydalis]
MTTQPDHPNPSDRPEGQAQPEPKDAVPTCYRHPDRETYVRCQRCDRSICPDCMRVASVGHQCVECVRDGSRNIRQAEAPFGGRPVTTPFVTWTLMAINVLVYLAEVVNAQEVVNRFAMSADHVAAGQWWRLFSGAFLHAPPPSYWHILFNMWALFVIGPQLERMLGSLRFLSVYLLAALGGSVAVYLFGDYAVGASGAIYGLFGAMFVVARRLGYDARGVLWLIGINAVLTFVIPGISWQGHLGGLVVGAIVTALFAYAPERNRKAFQLGTGLAVLAACVLIVVFLSPMGV